MNHARLFSSCMWLKLYSKDSQSPVYRPAAPAFPVDISVSGLDEQDAEAFCCWAKNPFWLLGG